MNLSFLLLCTHTLHIVFTPEGKMLQPYQLALLSKPKSLLAFIYVTFSP